MRRAGAREAPGLGDDLKRGEEVHDPIELLERVVVDNIHTEAIGRMKERRQGRRRREEDRLVDGGGDWRGMRRRGSQVVATTGGVG
jgi:hypothetical protein